MKSMRYLAAGTVMLLAAFCFFSYAYALDPTIEIPEGTFADSTGAFTFTVTVRNSATGQTGSIDGSVKKAHNVLPQPAIAPATLKLAPGEALTFTITGKLKNPSIAGSVDLKFKYVDDDTGKVNTVTADVLITPGT
jgi:hypothetical protein